MDVQKITNKKLEGDPLTDNELEFVIKSYVDNAIDDSSMGKFLKSIHLKGMEIDEIVSLTKIMIDSGETIDFSNLESYVADKHSTGGVGDKVSIILGPVLAALGSAVPMLAGRSLGHTGGTIDKLETIPGFRTDLSIADFKKNVERSGLCIMSQTNTICPADKKIYALRDVTGTIDSNPLICGSIMSKKIAEGIDGLVLDIKIGNGAFMRTLAKGKQLGNLLKYVGEKLIIDSGLTDTRSKATEMQIQCIDSGNAYDKFEEMVFNQGGYIGKTSELNEPLFSKKVISEKNGFIKSFDTTALGWAAVQMGCGRINKNDNLDNTAGIAFNVKVGDQVNKGDSIMQCFGSDENKVDQAYSQLKETFQIAEEKVESQAMVFRD